MSLKVLRYFLRMLSLKELCLEHLDESSITQILLNRDSHLNLYWEFVAMKFFRTWHLSTSMIDRTIINRLNDDALDIIYKWRSHIPNLYYLVIEREFWDTFFLF